MRDSEPPTSAGLGSAPRRRERPADEPRADPQTVGVVAAARLDVAHHVGVLHDRAQRLAEIAQHVNLLPRLADRPCSSSNPTGWRRRTASSRRGPVCPPSTTISAPLMIRRLVRDQEDDERRDLLGRARAPERRLLDVRRLGTSRAPRRSSPSRCTPGSTVLTRMPAVAELEARDARQPADAPLAHRVGDREVRPRARRSSSR